MAPVTEIAYISLKSGVELVGDSPTAKAWADTLKTIQAQDGYQRLHWGTAMEDESLLMLLIGTSPPSDETNLKTKTNIMRHKIGTVLKRIRSS